ncbi:MAG: prephenate dehydrogenase [Yaniella sp.]|uniref:prephenate dehydrogenase n=1 Tax=Yaniella sp. TaxID=2773929 RepID=UPI0017DF451F|nr:prephenate dehydrogenase [Yaniella sp.]NLZ98470.1 prephenate dehydrogenase [Micrococcus sp.]MDN5705177.1 prephenate dehydrogenase [Yaniella sp.]MDN5730907.1 prephenate dehydrogenase [Yaniella sp.]MDN5742507.1 prephenate dehydrogenase [Yaniella sp.]MDN5814965.1 prephenate dehydrogenase [Yaniella sp.]
MTTPRFSRTEIVDTASLAAATETISKQHSIHQPTLIIGSGLLGASIGLGLRSAGIEVLLSDPSPSAQAVAEDIGAGRGLTDQDQPGTVVVAAPPDVTGEEVIKALQRWPEAVVLDIASVKGAIAEELSAAFDAGRINGDDTKRYIGTHPMAGRERSGPVAARGELFTAAPWVLCPRDETPQFVIDTASDVARLLGATIYHMTAEEHDGAVAQISHLPQIAASLLASRLQDTSAQALQLAGNGLRDTTRIAASDGSLWVQILTANASQILPQLHGMKEDLDRLIHTLSQPFDAGSRLDVAQLMHEGNRGQARIPGKHGGPAESFALVTVLVDDAPGSIVSALQAVADVGVNVEDLRMEHSSGYQVGMLEIAVVPGQKQHLVDSLTDLGWKVL